MVSKGFSVSCYEWDEALRSPFAARYSEGFVHADSLEAFVKSIERPRRIMMMIKAGSPVDAVLRELAPLMEPGDVVIDGGNSQWEDTGRRMVFCEEQGFLFVGCGVSGGEEGALNGPALMPGGSEGAWPRMALSYEFFPFVPQDGQAGRLRYNLSITPVYRASEPSERSQNRPYRRRPACSTQSNSGLTKCHSCLLPLP